jgi:hypothetical protein
MLKRAMNIGNGGGGLEVAISNDMLPPSYKVVLGCFKLPQKKLVKFTI